MNMSADKKSFFSAKNITVLAILLALVIVMQTLGGAIVIGPVQLNFTLIPIVLGAIVLGPLSGAVLGFACGVVVLAQVIMGLAPFYVVIWTYSPVVTVFTCIVKTTVAGLVSGLLFQLISKKNRYAAVFVASGIVPVVNTSLFIIGCLLMGDTMAMMAEGANILEFILVSVVTFNFFLEFAINLLVAPAIHTVYKVVEKRIQK